MKNTGIRLQSMKIQAFHNPISKAGISDIVLPLVFDAGGLSDDSFPCYILCQWCFGINTELTRLANRTKRPIVQFICVASSRVAKVPKVAW